MLKENAILFIKKRVSMASRYMVWVLRSQVIASKSPVAVVGTKVSLNYSRDRSVQEPR